MYREVTTEPKQVGLDTLTIVEDTQPITAGPRQGLKFRHRLGRVPTIVQVQFSADESFDDVHVVQWPYGGEHNHGPVSMRADTRNVYLEFTDGPIFGAWTHNPPAWQNFNEGYFRVIAF